MLYTYRGSSEALGVTIPYVWYNLRPSYPFFSPLQIAFLILRLPITFRYPKALLLCNRPIGLIADFFWDLLCGDKPTVELDSRDPSQGPYRSISDLIGVAQIICLSHLLFLFSFELLQLRHHQYFLPIYLFESSPIYFGICLFSL